MQIKAINSVRQIIPVIVLSSGLAWVGYLLAGHVDSFYDVLPDSWFSFVVSLLFLSVSVILPSIIFTCLFFRASGSDQTWLTSLNLYFSAQLLKYVPGKIWGIVYQVTMSSGVSAWTIATVNIDFTVLSMLINVIFAVLVLGAKSVIPLTLAFCITTVGVVFLILYMLGGARSGLKYIFNFMPDRVGAKLRDLPANSMELQHILKLLSVQVISISIFCLSWNMLSNGYSELSELDFVGLGMIYVIASAIGIVTMISPAGLGVREASFVTLASGFASVNELAFIAVVARVWFVFSEVLAALSMLMAVYCISLISNPDKRSNTGRS